jgi:sulfofructose kinase
MTTEVLCVGHAAYDLNVFVEKFPEENTKTESADSLESGGGPAANAAWLLSSWGVRCAFAGLVGDDPYGRRVREEFEAVGTDVSLLELRPGHATPVSVILINRQTGSRTIVNRKLRAPALELGAKPFANISPKILLFDGHEPDASLAALRAFPDAASILDAGSWRDGTARLAGDVDYLVASERFARQATDLGSLSDDSTRRSCIGKLRECFPTAVVVTLGEEGLIADDRSGFRHLPAFPAQVVDTTGAGDIFHGAFAFAITRAMPFLESLRFAAMAASLSVRVAGGRSSTPTLAQVEEALTHVE